MNNSNLSFELEKCLILDNGNKVQNLRKLKKLTIKELAKSANVSEESLKSIECQKIELITKENDSSGSTAKLWTTDPISTTKFSNINLG